MEKSRDRRYASAGAMARDLRRFADGEPVRARRIGPVERAWRRVKRHKLVSALAISTAVLAIVGVAFAVAASRESDRRRSLEYDRLLARAEEEMSASHEAGQDEERSGSAGPGDALVLLDQAIGLAPDRPDAYWLRALLPWRSHPDRWQDVETAGRLGLARQTWRMTRARLLDEEKRFEEADEERLRAEAEERTPESAYFEGVLLAHQNRHAEAEKCLTEALMAAGARRHLRYLVHRRRAGVYEGLGDLAAALHDLRSLQEIGFDPLSVRVRIAYLERRMGRPAVADERLEPLLAEVRESDAPDVWENLASHLRRTGVRAWREQATSEALAAHPHHAGIQAERLLYLKDEKRFEEALPMAEAALQEQPKHHGLRSAQAQLLLAAGRNEDAVHAFEESLSLDPACLGCLLGHARAHYELGDLEKAILGWKKAIEVAPRTSVGYYHLALDYAETGRVDEAEAAYRRAIELNATDALSMNGLATLLLRRREDPPAALAMIKRALALQPDHAGLLITYGNVMMHQQKWEEARTALERSLELEPDGVDARVNLGIVLLQDPERGEDALALFRQAVDEAPDDASHHFLLTSALRRLGREKEAIRSARRAVEVGPDEARFHARLASLLLFGAGDQEGAREAVKRAFALPEPSSEAYVVRAVLRGDKSEASIESALEDYRLAVRIDPTEADGHRGTGLCLLRLGHPEEALEALEQALALDAKHASSHGWRAQCLHMLGRSAAALAAFDEGLEALPGNLHLLQSKALMLARDLHRLDAALAVLDEAQRHHPEAWQVSFNRAILLLGENRLDEAVASLLEVEAIVPDDPQRPYQRAEILLHHGRYEEAREGYERALSLRPGWDLPQFGLLHLLTETGAWDDLLARARAALEAMPAHPYVRFAFVRALRAKGLAEEAARQARAFVKDMDRDHLRWPYDHYPLAVAGEVEALLAGLPPAGHADGGDLYLMAVLHAIRGDDDAVVQALDASLARGYRRHAGSAHDPDLAARADPRIPERLAKFVK